MCWRTPTPHRATAYPAGGGDALSREAEANAGENSGLSNRGAMPAQAGRRIELWGPPQAPKPDQYLTVTAIRPITSCKGKAVGNQGQLIPATPKNDRFLAVDMTIENTSAYDSSQPGYYVGSAQQYDFVAVDGTAIDDVATLVAFYRTGEGSPFSNLEPGRTYTGTNYIDVSNSAGWLIFGQTNFAGTGYVAALVATGMSNKEVAAEMMLSVKTVRFHLTRVSRSWGSAPALSSRPAPRTRAGGDGVSGRAGSLTRPHRFAGQDPRAVRDHVRRCVDDPAGLQMLGVHFSVRQLGVCIRC